MHANVKETKQMNTWAHNNNIWRWYKWQTKCLSIFSYYAYHRWIALFNDEKSFEYLYHFKIVQLTCEFTKLTLSTTKIQCILIIVVSCAYCFHLQCKYSEYLSYVMFVKHHEQKKMAFNIDDTWFDHSSA